MGVRRADSDSCQLMDSSSTSAGYSSVVIITTILRAINVRPSVHPRAKRTGVNLVRILGPQGRTEKF